MCSYTVLLYPGGLVCQGMARLLDADREDSLQLCRSAANILNKQPLTLNKG